MHSSDHKEFPKRGWLIAAYCAAGIAWIVGSGYVFGKLHIDGQYEIAKGLLFVALTAILLDSLLRSHFRSVERATAVANRLIAQAPSAICIMDSDGLIIDCNPAMESFSGFTASELKGQTYQSLVDPDEREESERNINSLIKDRNLSPRIARTYRRKDGTRAYGKATGYPLETAEGRLLFVTMIEDITDTREAELALARRESMIRALNDNNLLGVVSWTLEGEITDANDAFLNMIGYSRADVEAGRLRWDSLTPPEWEEADKKAVQEIQLYGLQKEYEKEYLTKDGRRVPVLLRGMLLDRTTMSGVSFVVDLTALKAATKKAELLEKQLQQARKLEAVGQLAGGIAHDYNNLLAVIMLSVELISYTKEPERVQSLLQDIKAAAERGASLAQQMLAFSRKQMIQPKLIDVKKSVTDTSKLLGRLIGEDVRMTEVCAPDTPAIIADPAQITQILMNLATNARDAMPKGGTFKVETGRRVVTGSDDEFPSGTYACLRVSDTGEGMEPEVLQHVFEPFFTTKEQGKGTGLGLASVYGTVSQLGGYIKVESQPGAGTTFTICFPAAERTFIDSSERSRVEHSSKALNLLLVEDEPALRDALTKFLEQRQFSVIAAENGEDALEKIRGRIESIHLLLTDAVMPRLGGVELAERLLALQPTLKVLVMSGYAEQSGNSKANQFPRIQKPFTIKALLQSIDRVLQEAPRS